MGIEKRIKKFDFPKRFHTYLYMIQYPAGTKVAARDDLIRDLTYDFRRVKVDDKVIPKQKALSIVKNAIKEAIRDGIIVEDKYGIYLKGKELCQLEDGWKVVPFLAF